jgi:hypothetical protein
MKVGNTRALRNDEYQHWSYDQLITELENAMMPVGTESPIFQYLGHSFGNGCSHFFILHPPSLGIQPVIVAKVNTSLYASVYQSYTWKNIRNSEYLFFDEKYRIDVKSHEDLILFCLSH